MSDPGEGSDLGPCPECKSEYTAVGYGMCGDGSGFWMCLDCDFAERWEGQDAVEELTQ